MDAFVLVVGFHALILFVPSFGFAVSQPSHVCPLDRIAAGAIACSDWYEPIAIAEGDMAEDTGMPFFETTSGNFAAAMFTV